MPRRSVAGSRYPDDWKAIAALVKEQAGWRCVRCETPHGPPPAVLTVHHLDMDPANNRWHNLAALCQRCHLSIQHRVDLRRPWLFEHSDWFKPYVAAHYALRYLGQELSRDQVMARLDELLALEREAVLGVMP